MSQGLLTDKSRKVLGYYEIIKKLGEGAFG